MLTLVVEFSEQAHFFGVLDERNYGMLKKQLLTALISVGLAGAAHASDLAISRFQVVDPSGDIYRGAEVTFEVDIDNNDVASVSDAELIIDVPATMVVT